MDVVDIARWQFGIITVYHFLFVPLTIGLTALVALPGDAVAADRQPGVPPADEVLRQAAADQLRHRRGDRDRAGVPVRDELVGLLPLRRRRLRRAAGRSRGCSRSSSSRRSWACGSSAGTSCPAALHAACMWIVHLGTLVLGVVHPGRQLLDAAPRRLHLQPRHRSRRAHRLRRGDVQQGPAGDLPARHPGGVHDRRRVHGRGRRAGLRSREGGTPRTASSTARRSGSAPSSTLVAGLGRRDHRRRPGQGHDRGAADEDGRGRGALRDHRAAARRSRSSPSARPTAREEKFAVTVPVPAVLPRHRLLRRQGRGDQRPARGVRRRRTAATRARPTTRAGDYMPVIPVTYWSFRFMIGLGMVAAAGVGARAVADPARPGAQRALGPGRWASRCRSALLAANSFGLDLHRDGPPAVGGLRADDHRARRLAGRLGTSRRRPR